MLLLLKFFTRHWGWAIAVSIAVFSKIVWQSMALPEKIGLSRFFSNKQLELSGKTRYFEEVTWKSRLSGFFMEKQWAIGNSQFKISWLARIFWKKSVQVLLFMRLGICCLLSPTPTRHCFNYQNRLHRTFYKRPHFGKCFRHIIIQHTAMLFSNRRKW